MAWFFSLFLAASGVYMLFWAKRQRDEAVKIEVVRCKISEAPLVDAFDEDRRSHRDRIGTVLAFDHPKVWRLTNAQPKQLTRPDRTKLQYKLVWGTLFAIIAMAEAAYQSWLHAKLDALLPNTN